MREEYKIIDGYEDYMVSNYGKVFNIKSGKFLKLSKNKGGYLFVTILKNGKQKGFLVHRLVAQAFIENPLGLDTVDHRNRNKLDNRVENLQWLSRSQNASRFWSEQTTEEWKEWNKAVHRESIKKTHEKNKKPIICLETGKIYESTVQASKELKISPECIHYNLIGRNGHTHGLSFKFLFEENNNE